MPSAAVVAVVEDTAAVAAASGSEPVLGAG